jgi:pyruvate formate lyase activating enzyme
MSKTPESVLVGNLQKFSIEDGPGIRTTVFIKGCPLSCEWCHNPELIDPQQQLIKSPNNCIGCGYCVKICPQNALTMNSEEGVIIDRAKCDVCLKCTEECYAQALRPVAKPMTIEEILYIAEQDKGFYDNTEGGITVSGGEVLMHGNFVIKLIHEAGKRGINVCIDTCGFGNSQTLMEMALKENVTNILYDMKSIDDEIHKKYTGVSNQLIIDNLRMLAEDERTADKLIMRMPLIKGVVFKSFSLIFFTLGVSMLFLLSYFSTTNQFICYLAY